MKFALDLHIHSALSPCGDDDMTPNNIVNMALIKGLDVIAVTDHNSCFNLPAVIQVGIENGIMVIPGIEVQTREEVHMVCFFKKLENAMKFGEEIYKSLPDIKNNEEIFGRQLIIDQFDNIVGKADKLLLSSSSMSINEIVAMTAEYKGICIPAHIDRPANSIIANLGFIPNDLNINVLEISKRTTKEEMLKKYPYTKKYEFICSSDAHHLWDINEREYFIDADYLTFSALFEKFGYK